MAHGHISELDAHIGFWLRFVSNHVSSAFQRRVEAHGVSVSDWVALRLLYRSGEATPAELIAALGMTKSAVSKIVARLEQRRLVVNEELAHDGRARRVVLTDAGRTLVPVLARLADQNDAAFFGHLTDAQRAGLIRAMKKIVAIHQLKAAPVE